jgi:hypothetical protein
VKSSAAMESATTAMPATRRSFHWLKRDYR